MKYSEYISAKTKRTYFSESFIPPDAVEHDLKAWLQNRRDTWEEVKNIDPESGEALENGDAHSFFDLFIGGRGGRDGERSKNKNCFGVVFKKGIISPDTVKKILSGELQRADLTDEQVNAITNIVARCVDHRKYVMMIRNHNISYEKLSMYARVNKSTFRSILTENKGALDMDAQLRVYDYINDYILGSNMLLYDGDYDYADITNEQCDRLVEVMLGQDNGVPFITLSRERMQKDVIGLTNELKNEYRKKLDDDLDWDEIFEGMMAAAEHDNELECQRLNRMTEEEIEEEMRQRAEEEERDFVDFCRWMAEEESKPPKKPRLKDDRFKRFAKLYTLRQHCCYKDGRLIPERLACFIVLSELLQGSDLIRARYFTNSFSLEALFSDPRAELTRLSGELRIPYTDNNSELYRYISGNFDILSDLHAQTDCLLKNVTELSGAQHERAVIKALREKVPLPADAGKYARYEKFLSGKLVTVAKSDKPYFDPDPNTALIILSLIIERLNITPSSYIWYINDIITKLAYTETEWELRMMIRQFLLNGYTAHELLELVREVVKRRTKNKDIDR